ncbi:uncharacterized protein RCC_03154 [Ramularia collo-cygni]|uniref:Uncharacterized protein n=1 Tax=Ramularia collo-cygni TaxID=112498 RepID=A0A2D3UW56_9PEZI|nr:uncharacterized protein RCC_03154 [Ramularia collo-cygni]CZT17320.1 uncharacterized protein RCC_03154 [Ramularia collo-cygni]
MARIREQPPRRSKRIASREGSVAPSLASEEEERVRDRPVATNQNTLLRQHLTLRASPPRPQRSPPRSLSPAVAEHSSPATVTVPVEFTPRPNLLRRAFGFLSSPFGAALGLQHHTPAPSTPTPQQPLGMLPASRKRPALEMEPEHDSEPQEPQSKPEQAPKPDITLVNATPTRSKTPRGPSTLNRNHPSSLRAISERTENSAATVRAAARNAEPTPSRHRPISSVRSKRDQANNTPGRPRAWVRPAMPREPNADSRLAKLNHYNQMKDHVQSLEKDEELREMVARHRTKRVKIDDLVYIPHNRPGDPSGTFRVYDDDSEDEMEVDEDVELRKNVFDEVPGELSPSKKVERQPAVPKQHKNPVEAADQTPKPRAPEKILPPVQRAAPTPGELLHAQMLAGKPLELHQLKVPAEGTAWVFPSVSKRQEPYQDGTAQEARLGAILKMAYEHWMRSGEVLPVF